MQKLELYNAPQSICSQRVRFVLNAKGLAFTEHWLDLFAGDQLETDYLALNPGGVVPTLLHDGAPVIDSMAIMEYLEEVFPDADGLVPREPLTRAAMRALIRYVDEVATPAVRIPSYNLAFVPYFRGMSEEEFQALVDAKPLRHDFLRRIGRTGYAPSAMSRALDRLRQTVERVDQELGRSGGPWLLGPQITLADIAAMPVFVRMTDIRLDRLWQDRPAVAAWLAALRAEPAYAPTFYPGSLLTEQYPHVQDQLAGAAAGAAPVTA